MAFKVEKGTFGDTPLNGLGFVVIGRTPEAMIKGNWSVGLLLDARASAEQRDALTAIASGGAGGPMGALSGLIGKFLGGESADIRFEHDGPNWAVRAEGKVDMAAKAAMGIDPSNPKPISLLNGGHPASNEIFLAHTSRSSVHALGLDWGDMTGKNNGQFAPFAWKSA
jgi:hypothetical protein